MKFLSIFLVAVFIIIYTGPSFAEGTWNYYVDYNSIGVIASSGDYIWCATKNGIVRWNRHDNTHIHEVYASPEGCCWYRANNMVSLAVDDEGTAWLGNAYGKDQSWLFSFDGSVWETYTMENSGLPGGAGKLNFDRNGMLWISTANGTASYDGTTWKNYTEDGEGSELIYLLGIDHLNVKWFYTGAGVSSFDGATWTTHTAEDGIPDRVFYSMSVGADNVKWFALDSEALVSFDGETWTVHDELEWIASSVAVDADNIVWCGGTGGLARYDGSTWTYYTAENSGLPETGIRALTVDDEGILWISTDENDIRTGSGLTRFDGTNWSTWRVDGPQSYSVRCIAVDHNNVKWIGTSKKGLSGFDGKTWQTYTMADSIHIEIINELAVDNDNVLWMTYATKFKHLESYLKDWWVHGILSFDGTIWTKYPDEVTGIPAKSVPQIAVDHDNVKWFGTTSYDGTSWKTYATDGFGNAIGEPVAVDRNNVKWFGAPGGVSSFDGTDWEYHIIDDMTHPVRTIAADSDNKKWILSRDAEILSYDGNNWVKHHYPETIHNLEPGHIVSARYDMAVDSNDVVWFIAAEYDPGSWGGGLLSIDGDTWTYYRDNYWLMYGNDRLAIDHNNVIWGTYRGIVSFDPGSNNGGSTDVSKIDILPESVTLHANYPNPFNPATTITFTLPRQDFTTLVIYNIVGGKVRELLAEQRPAGAHSLVWDGLDDNGVPVSSGMYLAGLTQGRLRTIRKMVLIR